MAAVTGTASPEVSQAKWALCVGPRSWSAAKRGYTGPPSGTPGPALGNMGTVRILGCPALR